jgi:outer membrane protein assembly factor BamB
MNAPSQARVPVVNLTVDIAGVPTAIRAGVVASQDGRVYLVNADTGALVWSSAVLGEMLQAAPGGYIRAYDPNAVKLDSDIIIIGTRNSSSDNVVYGLNAATGAILWSFDNGGGANAIGVINGGVMTDTANRRIYFASRKQVGGSTSTLWCLSFTAGSASLIWSADVGDSDSSPILKGTNLYVGTNAGNLHKFDTASGTPSVPVWSYATSDGPVKNFPVMDWSSTAIYVSTTNQVWRFTDDGGTTTKTWSTPASGAGAIAAPSTSMLFSGALYVGSSNGSIVKLTDLTTATPTQTTIPVGSAAIGALAFDYTNGVLHAGSEAGIIYAVTP